MAGGVAGGTVPTPHIDSIAAEGANFVNGYAANGTCAPSRAALMSYFARLALRSARARRRRAGYRQQGKQVAR